MITFLFPWIIGAAIAGMLTVVAVHLLSVRKPPALLLPTARFLPDRDVRAISRTKRPSDVWLMLLRMLALLLAGLAASGVSWQSGASSRAVVVIATSEIVRDTTAATTLVQWRREDPLAVVFLADQRERMLQSAHEPGAVFPAAFRVAAQLAARHARLDSIELHVLTSHAALVDDAGWQVWRSVWPGQVIMHHTPDSVRATDLGRARRIVLVNATNAANTAIDDPVVSALEWHSAQHTSAGEKMVDTVVVLRDADQPAPARRGVTIRWPRSSVPEGWRAAAGGATSTDSALALVAGGQAIVAPWRVSADAPTPLSNSEGANTADTNASPTQTRATSAPHAIAWWSDGRVAATETPTADGCVRDVAVLVDAASDVLLSASANGVFSALWAPCLTNDRIAVSSLTARTADGPSAAAADRFRTSGATQRATGTTTRTIHAVLLALALAVLVIESLLRARSRTVAA